MDPNAAFDEAVNALKDADVQRALHALAHLIGWLSRGGFPPDAIETKLDALRDIIDEGDF